MLGKKHSNSVSRCEVLMLRAQLFVILVVDTNVVPSKIILEKGITWTAQQARSDCFCI